MDKRDVSWLIVRVLGLAFVINAGRYLFIIIENLMLASKADLGKTLLSQSSGLISGWVIEAVVYFIIGLFLLLDGKFLFEIINYDPEK